jgi:hypothetical protein
MIGNRPIQYYTTHVICDHPLQPYVEYALAHSNLPSHCPGTPPSPGPMNDYTAGFGETDLILFNTLCALFLLCACAIEYLLERRAPSKLPLEQTDQKQTGSMKSTQLLTL